MHGFNSQAMVSGTLVLTCACRRLWLVQLPLTPFGVVCWSAGRFPKVDASDKGTETDTNQNQQLCYHVLGQPQSQDVVVLADPQHSLWMFRAEVTDDGR
jgi:hypothetical protein